MNSFYVKILSGLIIFTLAACESSPKVETISYPSISDIPGITIYDNKQTDSIPDSVCWVGVFDNAKWNGVTSEYATNQLKYSVKPLMKEAMRKEGYRVEDFEDTYITRKKRRSINFIILCREIEILVTQVAEGICYDLKISISIHSNDGSDNIVFLDAWSRTLLDRGESRTWPDLYRKSVQNLLNNPKFRNALKI